MPLVDGQIQVRDLVMGPGTPYTLIAGFDPWSRQTRSDEGGDRAWNDGAWSGAEWAAAPVVPIPLRVRNPDDGTPGGWLAVHQALAAAFAPSASDVELRFAVGGREYVMFGRPRTVELAAETVRKGYALTRCAFVALDPAIYSGTEYTATLGLPIVSGGLTAPLSAPLTVGATVVAGRISATNAGTADAALRIRIDGPVVEPRVAVTTGTTVRMIRLWMSLAAGQWIDVDTAARTVVMNGTASRRGLATADGGWPVLPPGTSDISFAATAYDAAASLSVAWRDAWR